MARKKGPRKIHNQEENSSPNPTPTPTPTTTPPPENREQFKQNPASSSEHQEWTTVTQSHRDFQCDDKNKRNNKKEDNPRFLEECGVRSAWKQNDVVFASGRNNNGEDKENFPRPQSFHNKEGYYYKREMNTPARIVNPGCRFSPGKWRNFVKKETKEKPHGQEQEQQLPKNHTPQVTENAEKSPRIGTGANLGTAQNSSESQAMVVCHADGDQKTKSGSSQDPNMTVPSVEPTLRISSCLETIIKNILLLPDEWQQGNQWNRHVLSMQESYVM